MTREEAIDCLAVMYERSREGKRVYHNKYQDAFDMAMDALEAQAERTENTRKTHACDLISRQAEIDAILAVTGNSSVRELYEHVQEHGLSDMWSGGVNAAIDIIIAVPPAQPDVLACGEGELIAQPEIIQCKDCKHHHYDGEDIPYCDRIDYGYGWKDDDYCSMAERKTDG